MNHEGIFVAILSAGFVRVGLLISCLNWLKQCHPLFFTPILNSFGPETKNLAVEEFLKSNADWFLLLSPDITPPPQLPVMVGFGKPFISALYPRRVNLQTVTSAFKKEESYKPVESLPKGQLVEVDAVEMKCVFVRRDVFERIERPYFERVLLDESGISFLSEDIRFCEKVKEAGFKIYVHTGFICLNWQMLDLKNSLEVVLEPVE